MPTRPGRWLLAVALAAPRRRARPPRGGDGLPEGVISEIKVEGNVSITSEKVRGKLLSQARQPARRPRRSTPTSRSLNGTKWFSDVEAVPRARPQRPLGQELHPDLRRQGDARPDPRRVPRPEEASSSRRSRSSTGLKEGNRADATRTHLAVGQIQRLYDEKGYELAEVKLLEGGNPGDTRVVIGIFEGQKLHVGAIDFEGNVFATDGTLRTKITQQDPDPRLHRRQVPPRQPRRGRPQAQGVLPGAGLLRGRVTPVTRTGSSLGDVRLTFVISEGMRYKVRNISFEGNKKIPTDKLSEGLVMHSGQPILDTLKEADRKNLIAKYNELGCIDTQILPDAALHRRARRGRPRLPDRGGRPLPPRRAEDRQGNERTRTRSSAARRRWPACCRASRST